MNDSSHDNSPPRFHDTRAVTRGRGLDQAYRRAGDRTGRPVICLHGLLDTGASFARLITELTRDNAPALDCIAPDWRGHGDTPATPGDYWFPNYLADLEALLDDLRIDRPVVLVGHSMGGQIASLYAGVRPERVTALVTLDSLNVPDSGAEDAPARYRDWLDGRRQYPRARPAVYDNIDALGRRIARRYPELDEAERRELARNWLKPRQDGRWQLHTDPDHRRRMPYGFRAAEARAIWREVACPVLCIDGGDSPAGRAIGAEAMAERRACFADLTHRRIDGCGHMLHVQAPRAVAGYIADFLRRISDTP